MSTPMLLLPVVGLALLWAAGLGAADLVAKRLTREARAALAAPLAAAVFVCASPLALAGVRPLVVVTAVLGLLATLTVARARSVAPLVRKSALPAVVAGLALVLSAAPALRNGTWAAATPGNADPYLWVSQARALNDAPAGGPDEVTPDRVAYNFLTKEHWPTGLPVGLAAVAAVEGVDPVSAYEVFATMLSSLLALAAFFCARGCLRWSPRASMLAGGLIAANGLLLLSAYYGWQAQILITTFGTLAILTLPVCLDRKAHSRELLLPALFAAAGVAAYGWAFSAFASMALCVGCGCWLAQTRSSVRRRQMVLRIAAVAGLTLLLGLVPIIDAVKSYAASRGTASSVVLGFYNRYDWGFPSDSLGLIARLGPRDSPGSVWSGLALAFAVVLLAAGVARTRAFRNPRGHVLVAGSAGALAGLAILAVTRASPYVSLKLMGYSAPLLTLTALSAFVPRRTPQRPTRRTVILGTFSATLLFGITTVFTVLEGVFIVKPATSLSEVAAAAERLPKGHAIRIDYVDGWRQMWLVYYLRDRRLAVSRPSVTLTGFSAADAATHRSFTAPAAYAIAPDERGPAIWRGSGAAIYALSPHRHAPSGERIPALRRATQSQRPARLR